MSFHRRTRRRLLIDELLNWRQQRMKVDMREDSWVKEGDDGEKKECPEKLRPAFCMACQRQRKRSGHAGLFAGLSQRARPPPGGSAGGKMEGELCLFRHLDNWPFRSFGALCREIDPAESGVDTAEWGPFSLSATKGTIRAVRTTSTLVAKHDTLV
ncbi:uncharacterized protein An11g04190 [Aspergillus niger]|uniref:Contig An11c0160, genomic contig n=2 Tax=Aspergillus niger TaxID=5061 RepID=A2QW81_ASPNC|nr:uncharacterized protein An11g04190 [Aspergillus niger]CAK40651.1 unnamed protein product [Aspergillus niger]